MKDVEKKLDGISGRDRICRLQPYEVDFIREPENGTPEPEPEPDPTPEPTLPPNDGIDEETQQILDDIGKSIKFLGTLFEKLNNKIK